LDTIEICKRDLIPLYENEMEETETLCPSENDMEATEKCRAIILYSTVITKNAAKYTVN
jgi:hypothetical protein